MKRNGFTLIELLAVIVILAIIALIATPIILNIINDAKEESNERSVELYASAAKNAVAKYQLNNTGAPTSFDQLEIEYDGNVECTTEELYSDGSIYLADCTVNGDSVDYTYGTLEEGNTVEKVCELNDEDNDNVADVGEVVSCNIGEVPDKFYVIEEVNLSTVTQLKMLTEKNIHITEYRQSDDAGKLIYSEELYWLDGDYGEVLPEYEEIYPNVYDDNSLTKPVVDKYVEYLNTKSIGATGRLLILSEVESLGCDTYMLSCYQYDGNAPEWVYSTGYWVGTAFASNSIGLITQNGDFWGPGFDYNFKSANYGVRPVITISTSDIQ